MDSTDLNARKNIDYYDLSWLTLDGTSGQWTTSMQLLHKAWKLPPSLRNTGCLSLKSLGEDTTKLFTILPKLNPPSVAMSAHGCLHLNNFKAAKGTRPYRLIHSFFVACTSSEARKRKV